jgi:hypothetical protein
MSAPLYPWCWEQPLYGRTSSGKSNMSFVPPKRLDTDLIVWVSKVRNMLPCHAYQRISIFAKFNPLTCPPVVQETFPICSLCLIRIYENGVLFASFFQTKQNIKHVCKHQSKSSLFEVSTSINIKLSPSAKKKLSPHGF